VIFWGILADTRQVFYVHKKIIRIMVDTKMKVYCRELLRTFNI